ncbi:hypothetical protein NC653_023468 [Populus alba x Populus x berolinensis]|uniref:Uncharacterized protein n=1 Tax=Populus alba x Populus x berolinensis TaxID=444605 RepID=A0AAD6MH90_9ROSI|nr:hypothetical protein NC653_023468 [Populus alba x Populus x berolinensis]
MPAPSCNVIMQGNGSEAMLEMDMKQKIRYCFRKNARSRKDWCMVLAGLLKPSVSILKRFHLLFSFASSLQLRFRCSVSL